jgi:hypothetical protein
MRGRNLSSSAFSRRFTVAVLGPSRSETEVRADVEQALEEALIESGHEGKLTAKAEPEGGFLGAGAEWSWLYVALPYAKLAAGAVLAGALKKAGEEIFSIFLNKLRAKNILPRTSAASSAVGTERETSVTRKKASVSKRQSTGKKKKGRSGGKR